MRIAIVGSSGSGKSTLARRVSERLGIPQVEIDAYHHLSNWEPNPSFLDDLAGALDQPSWVCDGNYRQAEALTRGQADVIVVFDLPRRIVMRRVIVRTVRRAITREELWNGNREPLTNFYRWDPEKNVIRWSWVHHHQNRQRFRQAEESGAWSHAQVFWLHSLEDVDRWLESLG